MPTLQEILRNQKLQKDPSFATLEYLKRLEELANAGIKRKIEEVIAQIQQEFHSAVRELLATANSRVNALVNASVPELRKEIIKDLKGEKGDSVEGPQGPRPTNEELRLLIKPLIPVAKDGDDGRDAKPEDVVPLVIPLVLEKIPKQEEKKPNDIVEMINEAKKKIMPEKVDGLLERLDKIVEAIMKVSRGGGGGGGMSTPVHQSFATSSATTTLTLSNNVAANSFAIFGFYNGQFIVRGNHYTISGKTITLTFTPQDDTNIDFVYWRT